MSRRSVALAGLAGVLLYVSWMAWPYLKSIVTRDAAVTSWISVAAAPISGYTTNPLYPGSRVGADGHIATIVEPQADERDLARARAAAVSVTARMEAQSAEIDALRASLGMRSSRASRFTTAFVEDASVAMDSARSALSSVRLRLSLARDEQTRIEAMEAHGLASKTSVDAAHGATSDLERQVADADAALQRGEARQAAAAAGVFLGADGGGTADPLHHLSDARVQLSVAEAHLRQMRAEETAAKLVVVATAAAFEKTRSLAIKVPDGAMVWSLISGPGTPVQAGSPVASWVDCRVMLVDVPVSDVEAALLQRGSAADVVIEGESEVRRGKVILTRGAAGVLGPHDLAALAKGRRPDLGQALVQITPAARDIQRCDMGHAAFVDFPEVGAFDILRARLRW